MNKHEGIDDKIKFIREIQKNGTIPDMNQVPQRQPKKAKNMKRKKRQ